jgi:hypothetical protein
MIAQARTFFREGFMGARLITKLPSFLKQPISADEARKAVQARLDRREEDFLDHVRRFVYSRPDSPYLKLLDIAGCEFGDVQGLVRKEGVEAALGRLCDHGVYLTSKEFHGRCEVVRGASRFLIKPSTLMNPTSRPHVPLRSSGSRSSGTPVTMDLAFFRDTAVDTVFYLDARKSITSEKATWEVPGGVALYRILTLSLSGVPPVHWFSQLDLTGPGLDLRYKGSTRILELGGWLAQTSLPRPRFVPLEDPLPIVRWMEDSLRRGKTPHLFTYASSAVRLSLRAQEMGVDLKGTQITMSGEPTTEARLKTVRQSNAEVFPAMGSAECGYIGYGCLDPASPDDMHLLKDLHAVIQPGHGDSGSGLTPKSLLVTSLRPTAPLIMLNVSLGDQAELRSRRCGCPLGSVGLDVHLEHVRSPEKLTSGGMACFDSDIIRILEEVLPSRFGGAPTDYQILEDEVEDGRPRLKLIVHPSLGPLDETQLKSAFLGALGSGAGAEKLTSMLWRDTSILTVERGPAKTTSTGKILHMHIQNTGSKPES